MAAILQERLAGSPALAADTAALADRLRASTVEVGTRGRGNGSGVIWRDGLIITNHHVAQTDSPEVVLADGRSFPATVTARDPERDLAALKVSAAGLPVAEIGDSSELRAGQLVLAMGHPLGVKNALTLGIVHAVASGPGGSSRWIRADLTLAPGNSGGPMVNAQGQVIGKVQEALRVSPLLLIGIAIAPLMQWFFSSTRWGLYVRAVGDSPSAARAMGISVVRVRTLAIVSGSFLAGLGGASLSLYYPGLWSERISSGQGLMAVALVIFARWQPIHCLWAALFFGGAQALGPSLQAVGIGSYRYLFNAFPYILTLIIIIITCSPRRTLTGSPGALGTNE